MSSLDKLHDALPKHVREMVDEFAVDGASTAAGAGAAGLGAYVGYAVAGAVGLTGVAVPAFALGMGYLMYKKFQRPVQYGLRKAADEMFGEKDLESPE